MTLTESLISSFILVALTTQTGQLFGDSIEALGKSRLRDSVNAVIHRDIEDVRRIIASWKADVSMQANGQLAYSPEKIQCENGTLATAFLSESSNTLPASLNLNLSSIKTPLRNLIVLRTIEEVSGNANLIQVNYTTIGNTSLKTEANTTFTIPAQGWCPT